MRFGGNYLILRQNLTEIWIRFCKIHAHCGQTDLLVPYFWQDARGKWMCILGVGDFLRRGRSLIGLMLSNKHHQRRWFLPKRESSQECWRGDLSQTPAYTGHCTKFRHIQMQCGLLRASRLDFVVGVLCIDSDALATQMYSAPVNRGKRVGSTRGWLGFVRKVASLGQWVWTSLLGVDPLMVLGYPWLEATSFQEQEEDPVTATQILPTWCS